MKMSDDISSGLTQAERDQGLFSCAALAAHNLPAFDQILAPRHCLQRRSREVKKDAGGGERCETTRCREQDVQIR